MFLRTKSDFVSVENVLHTMIGRKANWIGHILRRNCLLKHCIEGNIEVTGRRGRRRKQLLDDFKEKRRYWKLKEEALDRTVWRTRFGRGYGPVVRQTMQ
jgi:predicted AlkP superfamily pyrophosphatase or phosphodiesterase